MVCIINVTLYLTREVWKSLVLSLKAYVKQLLSSVVLEEETQNFEKDTKKK
jgi:hypothetical protein